jgi:hypothetical protein
MHVRFGVSFWSRKLSGKETLLSLGVLVPALLYAILFLYVWFLSDELIFRPQPPSYRDTDGIIKVPIHDGLRISAKYLPNPNASFTILYSHGNSEDLGDIEQTLATLHNLGFAVFAYDYEGFGTSQGVPSEQHTYRDIDAAYSYLTTALAVPPDRLIAYGFSVGGGPAIDLASRQPLAGLIVESAFVSAFRVVLPIPLLPFDKFPNLDKIAAVTCPILILHGTADSMIPVQHAEQLFRAAHEPKRLVLVEGADHFGIKWDGHDRYARAMEEFPSLIRSHRQ